MEITVDTRALPKIEAEALVTYAFEQEKPVEGILARLDEAVGGALTKLARSGELTGKMLDTTLMYYPQGLAAQRLLIVGAGKKDKFGTAELRRLAGYGGAYAEDSPGEERRFSGARERTNGRRRRRPSWRE